MTQPEPVQPSILPIQPLQAPKEPGKGGETSFEEKSAKTTFSSMGELRAANPELYKEMMKGIAERIMKSMQAHIKRYKKIMRESQRQR